jgi:hypothetical protein
MATFYTIHAYDQESGRGDDLIEYQYLYTTFDKACDAIEEEIHDENFRRPDRTKMWEYLETHNYIHYYEDQHGVLFVVAKIGVKH